MNISAKEIESISALETFKRYRYLIKRVADQEMMYSLKSHEGNWAISTVNKMDLFPIWSSPEFAKNCAVDGWDSFEVEEISLNRFQDDLIKFIENHGFLLNIFPVGKPTGFVVDLQEFVRDLRDELAKYE